MSCWTPTDSLRKGENTVRFQQLDFEALPMSLKGMIESWYDGQFVPYENNANDSVVVFGGTYKRRWSARVARVLVNFWLNHWQWIIGTALAIMGLAVAMTHH